VNLRLGEKERESKCKIYLARYSLFSEQILLIYKRFIIISILLNINDVELNEIITEMELNEIIKWNVTKTSLLGMLAIIFQLYIVMRVR